LTASKGSGVEATSVINNKNCQQNVFYLLQESDDMEETPELGLSCTMPAVT